MNSISRLILIAALMLICSPTVAQKCCRPQPDEDSTQQIIDTASQVLSWVNFEFGQKPDLDWAEPALRNFVEKSNSTYRQYRLAHRSQMEIQQEKVRLQMRRQQIQTGLRNGPADGGVYGGRYFPPDRS